MDLSKTAQMITTDIDCQVVKHADIQHRNHLGASEIGDPCLRKLWYKFRWVKLARFSGRLLRLFDRGNREEAVFIRLLRAAGWDVQEHDPATGEQFRFNACRGHFGGSMDAVATPPEKYGFPGNVVCEFKTSKSSVWQRLHKHGVTKEHPRHAAQMHLYGTAAGVSHAVYLSVNKDDDNIHAEVIDVDTAAANALHAKAKTIIFATDTPPKMHQDSTFWLCKMCDYHAICHHSGAIDKNCRSCRWARPGENATWVCNKYRGFIPKEQVGIEHACWESVCG